MYNMPEHPLTREELKRRLEAVDGAKICLIGDFCLDIYWHADMRLSELSRETPHYPLPIVEERFSPGGAGNVACNIAALRPGSLRVVGAAGTDWRGDLLLRALAEGYVLEVGEETLEDTPCRRLTLDTTDADGEKVVCTVWLAEEDPVYAELSREGKLLLSVRFTAFQQTESDGGE